MLSSSVAVVLVRRRWSGRGHEGRRRRPDAYEARGFITGPSWVDDDLATAERDRDLAPAAELPAAATVAACVLTFGDGGNRAGSTLERL